MNKVFLLLCYVLAALFLYRETAGAGFVTDQIGWLQQYQQQGFGGLPNAFGDKSLHFVYHAAGFILWKLFGTNGTAWMLVFAGMHALVSFLSFRVFALLFDAEKVKHANSVAFLGSLLFLFSPYATEAVVWYACIHYLICSAQLLAAFYLLIRYSGSGGTRYHLVGYYVCFALAVFTLEISFTFPVIAGMWLMFGGVVAGRAKKLIVVIAPSLLLLGLYVTLSMALRGSPVGHYGASTHLQFSTTDLTAAVLKYTAKLFCFTQFLDYAKRDALYQYLSKPAMGFVALATGCIVAVFYLLKRNRVTPMLSTLVFLYASLVVALGAVLNLFFTYIVNVEGDRLSYFASVFAAQITALVVFGIFRKSAYLMMPLLIAGSFFLLKKNIAAWQQNLIVRQNLINTFRWQEAERIYILNLPDNYRGTYMFRSHAPDDKLTETLKLLGRGHMPGRIVNILHYNMVRPTDSVHVEVTSDTSLKVSFAQYDNWWWRAGIGASAYQTSDYDVTINEWNECFITFKRKEPNAIFLYQCGSNWRKLKGFQP